MEILSKYEKIPALLEFFQYLLFTAAIFAIIIVVVLLFCKPIQGDDRFIYALCILIGFVIAIMLIVWFVDKEIERFNERKSGR